MLAVFVGVFSVAFCYDLKSFVSDSEEYGFLWHITDVHIWYNYTVGADPDCEHDQCCFEKSEEQKYSAGYYGYLNRKDSHVLCDIPNWTFLETLKYMESFKETILHNALTSVMYTGDQPAHDCREQTAEQNVEHLLNTYKGFSDLKKKTGWNVFGSIGNHDTWPESQLDFLPGASWFFGNLSLVWKDFLSPEAMKTASQFGYYSDLIEPGFRVISINSQYLNPRNQFMEKYPGVALKLTKDFVETWLTYSRSHSEKVLLIGHVPISQESGWKLWSTSEWKETFVEITVEFEDVLVGSFFGHEHTDRVTIHKNANLEPVHVEFVAPSLGVGVVKVNPSIRLWKYNRVNFTLENYVHLWNDLEKSNQELNFTKNWNVEYDFKLEYGVEDMSPKSISTLLDSMEKDEKLLDKFLLFHHVGWYESPSYCDKSCRKTFLCANRFPDEENFKKCLES